MRRSEVWPANLEPRRGTAPGKTRPVLVVQCQPLIDAGHPSSLVVRLTANLVEDAEPLRVRAPPAGKLRKESDLLIDQLRAIDNRRLVQGPLTRLDVGLMRPVSETIREVLEL